MKTAALTLTGAGALIAAAALAGCVPPNARQPHADVPLKPVSRLDCPDAQGGLTRTSQAGDGQSCGYAGADGTVVQLKLLAVSGGDPQGALSPIEANLRQMATYAPSPPASGAPAESAAPAAAGDRDGDVNIDLPGVHIHASDGGKANVRVGPVHVDADDRTNSAHVETHANGFMGHGGGAVTVDANDSGAIIRTRSMGVNVNQDLILASDKPGPEGWRAVGYEALGPRNGPLVVAIVQSRSDQHDRLFADVKALVRKAASG